MRGIARLTSPLLLVAGTYAYAQAPRVDGQLGAGEWEESESVVLKYETDPGINTPAGEVTEARYKVQEGALYVMFKALDRNPAAIRARRRERDSISDEDFVGVTISPGGVRAMQAYSFYVSAGGTQADSRWDESEKDAYDSWDARWQSAADVSADGYTVEIRVPLTSLQLPAGKEQDWAMEFSRVQPRRYRYTYSSVPDDRNRNCYICQLQPVKATIDRKVDWRAIQARVDMLYQGGVYEDSDHISSSDTSKNIGVDATWRIINGLSAALTVNPDFSQVEADELRPVENVADAFFFEERRPFFIEAGQPYQQQLPLFYSRNIAAPDAAFSAKYLGKANSVSILYAKDGVTQLVEPGVEGSDQIEYRRSDGSSLPGQVLALRALHSAGVGTIGATATARSADGYSNRVIAVDSRVPLTQSTTLDASAAFSDTTSPDPEGTDGTGGAIYARLNRNALKWDYELAYERFSNAFRADLGSVSRVGIQSLEGELERTFYFNNSDTISKIGIQLDGWRREELGNGLLDRRTQLSLNVAGAGQTEATLWLINGQTRFGDRYWPRNGWELALDTAPNDAWKVSMNLLWVDDVDRLLERAADRRQLRMQIEWAPFESLRWQYDGTLKRLQTREGKLFDEQLHDLRGYYYFRNDLYLRGTLQFRLLQRDLGRYTNMDLAREVSSRDWQLLLVWRPTVWTSLYAGVSEGRDVDELLIEDQNLSKQRTWFVKASLSFDGYGILR